MGSVPEGRSDHTLRNPSLQSYCPFYFQVTVFNLEAKLCKVFVSINLLVLKIWIPVSSLALAFNAVFSGIFFAFFALFHSAFDHTLKHFLKLNVNIWKNTDMFNAQMFYFFW